MAFQTEIEFKLPRGYMDEGGMLHQEGTMRLATAADEILPLKDPRVQSNPAYLTVIVLSRVVTKLGGLPDVNPRIIENLFASPDFHRIHATQTDQLMAELESEKETLKKLFVRWEELEALKAASPDAKAD